mgnify:CR=1 FL=1
MAVGLPLALAGLVASFWGPKALAESAWTKAATAWRAAWLAARSAAAGADGGRVGDNPGATGTVVGRGLPLTASPSCPTTRGTTKARFPPSW